MISRMTPTALALASAVLISAALVALAGASPVTAWLALAEGAFGTPEGWSEVGVRTCPLLLTGLAITIAFRAGIWNIGAEGQLLLGAGATAWVGLHLGDVAPWLALPCVLGAAALAGALWASIAGVLREVRRVDEVIGTIMLNFIALGLIGYLVHGPLMEAAGRYPQTDTLPLAVRLPRLIAGYRVHAGLVLAGVGACVMQALLFRTALGFTLRAAGMNALAARLGGLRVERALLSSLAISGGLAGLAGGIEVSAVTFRLYEQFSPGYGFTAIAVALLGRLHPAGVVAAAVLFAALDVGSGAMQRRAGVSSVLVSVIQATVIFSLLAVEGWRWQRIPRGVAAGPAAGGAALPHA